MNEFDHNFVIGEQVLEREVFHAGGGAPASLRRVQPVDIVRPGAVRGRIRFI